MEGYFATPQSRAEAVIACGNRQLNGEEAELAAFLGKEIIAILQERQPPHIIAVSALKYAEAALWESPIARDMLDIVAADSCSAE